MRTIIVIFVVCLISGLLVYPWLTRSLNRARHAGRVVPPYDPGVNLLAGGDTSMAPYTVHIQSGGGHDHATGPSHSGDGGGHSGGMDGGGGHGGGGDGGGSGGGDGGGGGHG